MDRLSLYISIFTGAVLTGGLAIAFFSFDIYTWWAIAISAGLGFALAWPSAYIISRRIKRQDPEWNHRRVEEVDGVIPSRNAKEV